MRTFPGSPSFGRPGSRRVFARTGGTMARRSAKTRTIWAMPVTRPACRQRASARPSSGTRFSGIAELQDSWDQKPGRAGALLVARDSGNGQIAVYRQTSVHNGARSYWIPGSYETSSSMSAPSNALPRLRTLCTNSKNPRYSESFSWEIPRLDSSRPSS